jgi:LDH2 family malate/lactate/ureidoglycolate dehydrogenase
MRAGAPASPARCRCLFPDEARTRLRELGFAEPKVDALHAHFADAEGRGRPGHGFLRIEWLEKWTGLDPAAEPQLAVSEQGYERWQGNGALGYLVLDAVVRAELASPPEHARLVVCEATFPTGMLGHWTRRLADGGLVALLTATSPRRLGHPDGGPSLTGTNPLSIAVPSSDGAPVVADVSMGNLTFGDVLAGRAEEDDLAPFGGPHAHKAFALAVGLQLLVDALAPGEGFGAVLLVARPEADPVPALRRLAGDIRLPGGG